VLTWRIATALDCTFVCETLLALQEKLLPFTATLTALGI